MTSAVENGKEIVFRSELTIHTQRGSGKSERGKSGGIGVLPIFSTGWRNCVSAEAGDGVCVDFVGIRT